MKNLRSIIFTAIVLFVFITLGCSSDDEIEPSTFTSMDQEKFMGHWAGIYHCNDPMADTLVILQGFKELDFRIVLHAQAFNADTLHGELTDVNTIQIPEQEIAFAPGSGKITFSNEKLSLSQTGFGITCKGNNYSRF